MSNVISFSKATKEHTFRQLEELRSSIMQRLKEIGITCTPIPKRHVIRGMRVTENLGPIAIDTVVKFKLQKITNEDFIYAYHEATIAIVEQARPCGCNAVMDIEHKVMTVTEDEDFIYVTVATKGLAVRLTHKLK